ncbi:hypothetical protein DPMN_108041 [Dreissena polymorpha]|uniref:Uncharacterized protein n=1 Tax=Dreissena polymorpha TaxID=45954 RepID=A0A9D4QKJ4_DREPO|nr:hypothetical protein DPMN_108041 [Dreissena polymorpha]
MNAGSKGVAVDVFTSIWHVATVSKQVAEFCIPFICPESETETNLKVRREFTK